MIKNKLESLSGAKFKAFKMSALVEINPLVGPKYHVQTVTRDGRCFDQDRFVTGSTESTNPSTGECADLEVFVNGNWIDPYKK